MLTNLFSMEDQIPVRRHWLWGVVCHKKDSVNMTKRFREHERRDRDISVGEWHLFQRYSTTLGGSTFQGIPTRTSDFEDETIPVDFRFIYGSTSVLDTPSSIGEIQQLQFRYTNDFRFKDIGPDFISEWYTIKSESESKDRVVLPMTCVIKERTG